MSARHSEFLVDLGGADAVARAGLGSDYLGGPTDLSGVLTAIRQGQCTHLQAVAGMATGQQIDGSLMEARCGAKVHISLAVGTGDWLVCPARRTIFNLGPGASVFASGVLDNCPSPVLLGFSR